MHYRAYPPVERLAPFLECVWTLEGHANELAGETQPVLPDGRSELVVHFGDPFERIERNAVERQPYVLFAGQLAERLVLRPTGRISVIGVRFRPHGVAAFTREPQARLVGVTVDASSVSGALGSTGNYVREFAKSPDDGVSLIQQRLIERLSACSPDPRVASAVHAIEHSGGLAAIEDLSASLETTRRHLERLFLQHVGLSPKRLARITRFQRALAVLEGAGPSAGVVAAHSCGYADQAHFIREFRGLAGCSPGRHLLDRAELTGFFSSAGTTRGSQASNDLRK